MAIDYSKWDKIEISDDSDIEVHPNVDKRSFIRWKQQSIHEQREKRKQDIRNLEFQIEMYGHLNKRVDKLMEALSDRELVDRERVTRFLNENFDKTEKGSGENVDPDMPPYNEMVEDLFEQLERNAAEEKKDPKDGTVLREQMQKHREKIRTVTAEARTKLDELYKEKAMHISSEDIHTGFDRSFVNKGKDGDQATFMPVPAKPDQAALPDSLKLVPTDFIDFKDDPMKLAPETEQFGSVPVGNYKASEAYLLDHVSILSEQQKDALMMQAFEYQLAGDEKKAYQVIHQSELMSYIREIYAMKKIPHLNAEELKEVIRVFFQKVFYNTNNKMGKSSFLESVQSKFKHVTERCKVLANEQADTTEGGVETIQLKSLDESTELQVNLPDAQSKDPKEIQKVAAFNKLPKTMQDAVKTQKLDAINEVFAEMSIEEAEAILEIFNEGEIIGVNALLEGEEEFKELQEHYNQEKNMEQLSIGEVDGSSSSAPQDTANIID
ncbi:AGL154Wp [Eremothecium gossypii ATCC 10895]|uniref:Hsp90 chaperone protein kinase-targeting subunit n=1 Tax=Eremothecium gossypii (strain ATCC 10895 / CBS 109.51 / FGSC 9923 / NRRL Y-1056) TaxID=284811 RepID=Q750U3_EREGS|nr:AGL154Wp [Eremothecium gossypii ATCC 10895]AAS54337.1 AGL154Wp [Eremothecium gossypii ATCC 10895]AEY98664.1 FAGL154Wp [Eremothecium gossypii FDAG1]